MMVVKVDFTTRGRLLLKHLLPTCCCIQSSCAQLLTAGGHRHRPMQPCAITAPLLVLSSFGYHMQTCNSSSAVLGLLLLMWH
jgi:hypothetical protein